MHQNMYFQQKIQKVFWGGAEGAQPAPPQTLPQWGGGTPPDSPHPSGVCGTSTPIILKFWVHHCCF